mmetsp:Transcript_6547/g.15542  ORF Transcript_6547/g.15542 Transcript_6547/m.15542 type:complete len:202 (-) Transcript_6547:126-731(-)
MWRAWSTLHVQRRSFWPRLLLHPGSCEPWLASTRVRPHASLEPLACWTFAVRWLRQERRAACWHRRPAQLRQGYVRRWRCRALHRKRASRVGAQAMRTPPRAPQLSALRDLLSRRSCRSWPVPCGVLHSWTPRAPCGVFAAGCFGTARLTWLSVRDARGHCRFWPTSSERPQRHALTKQTLACRVRMDLSCAAMCKRLLHV